MDWGLLDAKTGDSRFLREEIVYSSTVRNITNITILACKTSIN